MDCFDGQKSTEKQSGDQRENSIKEPPGLLEVRHINTSVSMVLTSMETIPVNV